MRRWILLSVLAGVGCGSKAPTSTAAEPVAEPSAAAGPAAQSRPAPAKEPIADFAGVVNLDGTPRSRQDLLGHPTVVWFFPFAGTPG